MKGFNYMKTIKIVISLCIIFLFSMSIIAQEEMDEKTKKEINKHFKKGVKHFIDRDYKNASTEFKKVLDLDGQNKKAKEYMDKSQKIFNDAQKAYLSIQWMNVPSII